MNIATANRITGMKSYYFSRKLQELKTMQQNGTDVINLGIGNPADPPAPEVIQALSETAMQEHVHGYQGYTGHDRLRSAFSRWMKRFFNHRPDPVTEVLASMGSKEAIMHLSMAFLNKGDAVLVPDPGYPSYSAAAKMMEARSIPYNLKPENYWLPDFFELETLMEQYPVKIMWINYPHMPTGAKANPETFRKLIDLAQKHGVLLIHDNPYALVRNNNPLSILAFSGAAKNAIELHSLSKSHNMAGWRVGFIVGDKQLLDAVMKVKSNMNTGSFFPVQAAASRALDLERWWYDEQNRKYNEKVATGHAIMDALKCRYDNNQAGMFIWGRIPGEYSDASALSDQLLYNNGVFIAPGFIFGDNGRNYIRLSISVSKEQLINALQRIRSKQAVPENQFKQFGT